MTSLRTFAVATVSALYMYPVKSCAGVRVSEAQVTSGGFAGDRRWMIVDSGGCFVTQRDRPELCLIAAEFDETELVLRARERSLRIPRAYEEGAQRTVSVWRDRVSAVVHEEGSAWISDVLESPHQLVYMPEYSLRSVNAEYGRPGERVSFADAFPFLLLTSSAVDALNRRLDQPVGVERFRPNIVVSGAAAHAEDRWKALLIGDVAFRVTKPCDRCSIVSVDPKTGERGVEPLRTLARYRNRGGKVMFGMNLCNSSTGKLRVGDSVLHLNPENSV